MLAVFTTMKTIISKVMVSLPGCKALRSCMALIPRGVAAFPSPKRLASKFKVMEVIAGCSGGIFLKSRLTKY